MVRIPNSILAVFLGLISWQIALGGIPGAMLTGSDDAVMLRTDASTRQVRVEEHRADGRIVTHSIAHVAAGAEQAVKIKIPEGSSLDRLKIVTSPFDLLPADAYSQPVLKPGRVSASSSTLVKTQISAEIQHRPDSVTVGGRTFFSDPQAGLRMVSGADNGASQCFTQSLTCTPVRLHVREPRVYWSGENAGGTLAGSVAYDDFGFGASTSVELEGKRLASFLTDNFFVVITESTRDVQSDASPWKTGLLVHRLSLDVNGIEVPPEFFVVPGASHSRNRIMRSGGLTFLVTDSQMSVGLQSTLHALDIGASTTKSDHALLLSGYFRLKRGVRWLQSGALAVVSETWPPEMGVPQPLFVDIFSADENAASKKGYPSRTVSIPVFESLRSVHWEEETLFVTENPVAGPVTVNLGGSLPTKWNSFLPGGPWLVQAVNTPYLLAIRNVDACTEAKLFHSGSGQLLHEITLPEYRDATELRILTAPGGFWIEEPGASHLGMMLTVQRRRLYASKPVHLANPAIAVWRSAYGTTSVATSGKILEFQNATMELLSNTPMTGDHPPDGVIGEHLVSINTDSTWETPSATVQSRALNDSGATTVSTMIGPGWLAGYLIHGSVLYTARYQQKLVASDAGEELTGFLLFDRIDFSGEKPVKHSGSERALHRLYQQPRLHGVPTSEGCILWALPNQDKSQLEFIITRPEASPFVLSHYGITLPPGETLSALQVGGSYLLAATIRQGSGPNSIQETFVRRIAVYSNHKLALGDPVAIGGSLMAAASSGGDGCYLCVKAAPGQICVEYFDGVRSYALAGGDLSVSGEMKAVRDGDALRVASFGGDRLAVGTWRYPEGWMQDSTNLSITKERPMVVHKYRDQIIVAENLHAMHRVPLSIPEPSPDRPVGSSKGRTLEVSEIVSRRGDDFVGSLNEGRDWANAPLQPPKETFGAWVARQAWPQPSPLPDGDDDGDGFTNLAEYALGTDPTRTSSRPVFSVHTDSTGTVFRYVRNPAATGLTIQAEIARDLKNWDSSPSPAGVVTVLAGGEPHRPGYFRLRISGDSEE